MTRYLVLTNGRSRTGYYAGLLSAAFMAGSVLSSNFWGLVADRFGCRLVFLVGLLSSVVLSLAFGVSTSFMWAFVFR